MPKKKHPEHVNLERWLVSYADFITLLFAFFVILYASSKTDAAKMKKVAESLRVAFSGDAVDMSGKTSGKTLNQFDEKLPVGGMLVDMPTGKISITGQDTQELRRIEELLEESISFDLGVSDYAEKMQIDYEDRGLVVRLSAKDFFAQGDAAVKPEALPLLDQIAKILKTVNRRIRIEGHTDNQKVVSEMYPSNWELSTARATWIVRYLIKKFEFNPKLLEASGLAEFHPIASNDTESGRARNRRVEIIILSKDPK